MSVDVLVPQEGQKIFLREARDGGKRKILEEENSVEEDGQYLKEADGMSQQYTVEP